jgi:hypothetical protein
MKKINYKGWKNCFELKNELVTMVVTADVGPRVIFFGFNEEENIFQNYEDMVGLTGGDEWRIYGGHRLWAAPEIQPRTYFPDNRPVKVEERKDCVRFSAPIEESNRIEKQIDISLDPQQAKAKLVHRIINHNPWGIELAPWALSVMRPGGQVIVPFAPRGTHSTNLLPNINLVGWTYTNMADPRWTWGRKYYRLQSQPGNPVPQKIGSNVVDGWAAYLYADWAFIKRFDFQPDFVYPDLGVNFETFTNEDMLEVETLGPLHWLQPGESVEHTEHWSLHNNLPIIETEEDIDQHVLPLLK